MSLGDLFTFGGQAIQDLFGSEGATAEANSYSSAAQLAQQNAQLTEASTRIQNTQLARQIYQTEGTQLTDVAAAGFTESGSALDLLRSSAQQGSLAKSLTNIQGAINENAYAEQAGAYEGAAKAAGENAKSNTIGAIASIGGALVNGGGDLLKAGKTVVQGVTSLFSSAPEIGSVFSGASAASSAANTAAFLNPSGAVDFAGQFGGSAVDQALAGGSDLSSFFASSGIGLDTSELAIGTDAAVAESGIGAAFGEITDSIGSALGDVASSLGLDSLDFGIGSLGLDFLGPAGLALSIASFIPGVGDVINSVVGGVEDAIGDVFSGIGSLFGSIICTAFYKQGMIDRKTWLGDQRYGANCNPIVLKGYYLWGVPVANKILKSKRVARFLFPVFRGAIYEMASEMQIGQSTLRGKISLKLFLGISFILGSIMIKHEEVFHAHKA